MKEHLAQAVRTHRDKGETGYGPAGEVKLGIPMFFDQELEVCIDNMFRHLTNAYLDAYCFARDASLYEGKLRKAGELVRELIRGVK